MPVLISAIVAGGALALAALLITLQGLPVGIAVHAALMLIAWGVLLPAGGIVARYFKVTPHQNYPVEVENLFWWHWHRGLQYVGLTLATFGLIAIVRETGGRFDTAHGILGLLVMSFGWLQVVSTWFRGDKGGPTGKSADPADPTTWRGHHYDMTPRRRAFEAWHKRAGWLVILLASVTLLLGIALIGAPAWLLGVAGALQSGTMVAALDGRLRHRWVDTYHALWGPDPVHPGNRTAKALAKPEVRSATPDLADDP